TLFSTQPSVSSNGTLTFTPAANVTGSATVTVQLHDNGGTASGGADTSSAQNFTITVQSNASLTTTSFDFDAVSSGGTTVAGYRSVLSSTLISGGLGYGWVTAPTGGFDRPNSNLLLRDGNYGSWQAAGARVFQANVANGSYLVNITMGDFGYTRD